jgi:hypothetical protein
MAMLAPVPARRPAHALPYSPAWQGGITLSMARAFGHVGLEEPRAPDLCYRLAIVGLRAGAFVRNPLRPDSVIVNYQFDVIALKGISE